MFLWKTEPLLRSASGWGKHTLSRHSGACEACEPGIVEIRVHAKTRVPE